MNRFISSCAAVALCTGCAINTHSFNDVSYSEDGTIIRKVTAKSRTVSPPFKDARTLAGHSLNMVESPGGWFVTMGATVEQTGGEVDPKLVNAIRLISTL